MYNTGMATRKHSYKQNRGRLSQAATEYELHTGKTQNLPRSSDRQILVGDAEGLGLQKFSYTHTHTYGKNIPGRS